jgi:hypothetical protein
VDVNQNKEAVMCEFVSWIEFEGEIFYLNNQKLKTKKGKELIKYLVDRFKYDICLAMTLLRGLRR